MSLQAQSHIRFHLWGMTFHKFFLPSASPPFERFGFLVVFIQLKFEMNERRKNNYGSSASSTIRETYSIHTCWFVPFLWLCWCWTWAAEGRAVFEFKSRQKVEKPILSVSFSIVGHFRTYSKTNADRHRIIMVSLEHTFFLLFGWGLGCKQMRTLTQTRQRNKIFEMWLVYFRSV